MRCLPVALAIAAAIVLAAGPARAVSDAELIDGFNRSVFGSEFPTWGWQARIVKKYTKPVRFYIDDRSAAGKHDAAARFIRSLPALVEGLDTVLVDRPAAANFRVFIVDRQDYRRVVAEDIFGRPSAAFVPGKCIVRIVSGPDGIARSDAVIVADEGAFLFNRCLVEEILQGLGPVNDDRSLTKSVFNDASRHSSFTRFDRYLLNMLYHPKVRAGARRGEIDKVLPGVLRDIRARLR